MIYIYLAIIFFVIVIATVSASRKRVAPVQPDEYGYPTIVNREDFSGTSKELLVVCFTSNVCDSCEGVWVKTQILESETVAVYNAIYEDSQGKKLHEKYSIDAVPTTIICDKDGVTLKSYIGSVTATDLWAGVASARGADIQECSDH